MAPNAGGAPLTHRFSYQRDFGSYEDFTTTLKGEARNNLLLLGSFS
jgi:hypothetical protein